MSVFSGMSRPMKAAGVVLVGVAIIAAVIGGISALSGGDGSNEAGPSGTATQPGTSGGTSRRRALAVVTAAVVHFDEPRRRPRRRRPPRPRGSRRPASRGSRG